MTDHKPWPCWSCKHLSAANGQTNVHSCLRPTSTGHLSWPEHKYLQGMHEMWRNLATGTVLRGETEAAPWQCPVAEAK